MKNRHDPVPACWNCGRATREIHFCEHCASLQPPHGDYFQYLDLPRKLQINLEDLEKRFYALSRRLHPDVFFQRPEWERQLSLDSAAFLNDAHRTLQDPVSRAEYLLSLEGVGMSDAPAELVEEIFELRAVLEQARQGDNSVMPRLVDAKARLQEMLREADDSLEGAFDGWDRTASATELESIACILSRRSYIVNLVAEVEAALV